MTSIALPDDKEASLWLEQIAKKLGAGLPRKFPLFQRINNHLHAPAWLGHGSDDPLTLIYHHQVDVFERGRLVWGNLVQAHSLLFSPGGGNHPMVVVYQLDPPVLHTFARGLRVAETLFELRRHQVDHPAGARLADMLNDEHRHYFQVPVPASVLPDPDAGCQFACSTFVMHREHLPIGYLVVNWFPLLIQTHRPFAGVVVPHWYWPKAMVERWYQTDEAHFHEADG